MNKIDAIKKQKEGINKYWIKTKKEFMESTYSDWDKYLRDKNDNIYVKMLDNFKLIEQNQTHKIYQCRCGSVIKKKFAIWAGNTSLKAHLKSKKHTNHELKYYYGGI